LQKNSARLGKGKHKGGVQESQYHENDALRAELVVGERKMGQMEVFMYGKSQGERGSRENAPPVSRRRKVSSKLAPGRNKKNQEKENPGGSKSRLAIR